MKFDVVIGNPPYQDGNEAIWKKLSKKCLTLANIVALVTPRNIVNGRQTQNGSTGGFFEEIKPFLSYIDYNADNYFKVNKKICSWIYNKDHTGKTKIKTSKSEIIDIDLSQYNYLPYNFNSSKDFSIFEKIDRYPKMKEFTDVKSKLALPYLVVPAIKHISLNFVIVVTNLKTDPRVTAKDIIGYRLNNNEIAGCQDFRNSKIFLYIFNLFGGADVRAGIFRKFPKIDFTRNWTDNDLYSYFNFTNGEINYIEENIK